MEKLRLKEKDWLNQLGIKLPFQLHDCQLEILKHIMDKKGFLAVIPTGKGKTLLGVMKAAHVKLTDGKTMLLAPYRALTVEHIETLKSYGFNTMIDTGEHSKDINDYLKNFDVVVSTYEKADSIMRNYNPKMETQKRDVIFNRIDCIIIDEVHYIEDEERGINLESFIMCIKYLYPHINIVGLSATIGNYPEVAKWLGVPYVYDPPQNRPVPLDVKFIPIESFRNEEQFVEKMEYLNEDYRKYPNDKRMIAVTAVDRTKKIVFILSRVDPNNNLTLQYFMKKHRMAWHHSGKKGMSEDDRMAVEWAFEYEDLPDDDQYEYETKEETIIINRKKWLKEKYDLDHGINLIVCSPTLIVGRNLPVTRIDVFDHIQFDYRHGPRIIAPNRLQQTIGRAGRQKFAKGDPNYKGVASIYVTWKDMEQMKDNLKPFNVTSHLRDRLGEQILVWINIGIIKKEEDVYKFLANSFEPTIANDKTLITEEIKFLKEHKFFEIINGEMRVTEPRGKETINMFIQPETVVQWGAILGNQLRDPSSLEIFTIDLMNVEEFYKEVSVISSDEEPVEAMRRMFHLGDEYEDMTIKAFMFTFPKYFFDKTGYLESKYKSLSIAMKNGETSNVKDSFDRFMTACSRIYQNHPTAKQIDIIKFMVRSGQFSMEMASLMSAPGIGEAYASKLLSSGIKSKEMLIETYKTNPRKVMSAMGVQAIRLEGIMAKINEKKR